MIFTDWQLNIIHNYSQLSNSQILNFSLRSFDHKGLQKSVIIIISSTNLAATTESGSDGLQQKTVIQCTETTDITLYAKNWVYTIVMLQNNTKKTKVLVAVLVPIVFKSHTGDSDLPVKWKHTIMTMMISLYNSKYTDVYQTTDCHASTAAQRCGQRERYGFRGNPAGKENEFARFLLERKLML